MVEISIAELPEQFRKQAERASEMEIKNVAYAIEIYANILKQQPNCLELRRKLRAAQIKKNGPGNTLSSFLGKVTAAPFKITGKSKIEKDPMKTMAEAEKSLASHPGRKQQ